MKAIGFFLARMAVLLLALACAAAALAAQGGRFSDRLDILTHFAPLWLAGGVLAGGLWLVFLRRRGETATAVLASLAMLSSSALMAPDLVAALGTDRGPASGPTLKLIQFNVWGRNADPEGTVAWILAEKPDVLVLEEANNDSRMLELVGPHFANRTTCSEPHPCSTTIFYQPPALAEGAFEKPEKGKALYLPAAWATIPGPGGPFTVLGAHNTWPVPAGPQQAQSRQLAKVVGRYDRRTMIVAGDFNSTPWSFSLRRQDKAFGLERRTRALASWPAGDISRHRIRTLFPVLPIDHVYAGPGWRTVSVRRGPRLGSDHYPIVVVLEPVSPEAPRAPSKAAR